MEDLRALITRLATELRFSEVRFTPVPDGDAPRTPELDQWIADGLHSGMTWLANGRDPRADPRLRFKSARTAVVLSLRYPHARPPDPGGRTGMVARYAWGRDYHNLIGKRLDKLRKRLLLHGVRAWGGVDASPIYERGWAWAAGLGFTGKNCLQILPSRGSYFFLAVMFVDAPLEGDGPMADFCGRCTRCLTGCPTGAFLSPRRLDAGRCISYWTIEARELAPPELLPAFGRWIFGCDLCQEVCPHNHRPDPADEDDLLPRNAWLDLDELIATPDDALEAQYTGTPLRRPGARGLKRNALVALGNIGDPGAEHSITLGLNHPDGMVRDAAAWAAARLAGDTLRARR